MRAPADLLSRPRLLHPLAWWGWGLMLCVAVSRTTSPVYLGVLAVVVLLVVALRREIGSSTSLGVFLVVAAVALVLRLLLTVLIGGEGGTRVLLDLPSVAVPDWLAGVRIGGPVYLESVLGTLYHGLQLGALLLAVGACQVLADPRRLLQHLPTTLYDVGSALVVSLTVVPQLAEEAREVRRARRLRGHSGAGPRELARTVVPVLESALERAMDYAASMESRGYGRITLSPAAHRRASALTVVGLAGVLVGLVGVSSSAMPTGVSLLLLAGGSACAVGALGTGTRADRRRPYRPDPFRLPEVLVLLSAVPAAVGLVVAGARQDPTLSPTTSAWPGVTGWLVVVAAVPVLAGVLAPRPPRRVALEERLAAQEDR